MAIARPTLGLVATIFVSASLLFNLFIILSGYVSITPFGKTFFLEANVPGQGTQRWTYLSICGVDSNGYSACSYTSPAIPFPSITYNGIPDEFSASKYYYLSRVAWAFYIISFFFQAVSWFMSILALCSRLGAYLTGATTGLALLFQVVAAALMTAWTVLGRNTFQSSGVDASLGTYAYAWTWASVALLFLATTFYCLGGGLSGRDNTKSAFGRKRSTRSRGSFIDNESGRRVKDEYD